ncbi:hypothetical protein Gotri_027634 [Gossypium trilobum]|uniref:Uncharacterized protein n=1 Tax=Gossypium trilobum TaxID=34281 RepID=A0A7J9FNC6_9ROSI|nr:hypothetical protein [Gossypium trilobum]
MADLTAAWSQYLVKGIDTPSNEGMISETLVTLSGMLLQGKCGRGWKLLDFNTGLVRLKPTGFIVGDKMIRIEWWYWPLKVVPKDRSEEEEDVAEGSSTCCSRCLNAFELTNKRLLWLAVKTKEALVFGQAKLSRIRKRGLRKGEPVYYYTMWLNVNYDMRSSGPCRWDTTVFKHQVQNMMCEALSLAERTLWCLNIKQHHDDDQKALWGDNAMMLRSFGATTQRGITCKTIAQLL